jgi:hypothetical protein
MMIDLLPNPFLTGVVLKKNFIIYDFSHNFFLNSSYYDLESSVSFS